MNLKSPKVKEITYSMDDLPALIKDEDFYSAIEVIRVEGINIKYGKDHNSRKRADLTELRNLAYTIQRDARSTGHDTGVIRDIIKGLNTGQSY